MKKDKCKAGQYTTNSIVTHSPLVCFGGFGQPRCGYLTECLSMYLDEKKLKRVLKRLLTICPKCGKKMKQVKDKMTGTITGHLWACECSPKKQISIG